MEGPPTTVDRSRVAAAAAAAAACGLRGFFSRKKGGGGQKQAVVVVACDGLLQGRAMMSRFSSPLFSLKMPASRSSCFAMRSCARLKGRGKAL